MRPDIFKKYCSYLFAIRQEKFESAVNGTLEVLLFKGRYQLVTKNAIYSFEDLYTSYGHALNAIRYTNVKNILVLGLGLGSIPIMLQKKLGDTISITSVELDPEIIRCAKKYYPSATDYDKLNIIQSDALQYVMQTKEKFDLITVDLFVDTYVPEQFFTLEFLQKLKSIISPNGNLLFSRLKDGYKYEHELWKNLKTVFPGKTEIETEGNSILYWKPNFES